MDAKTSQHIDEMIAGFRPLTDEERRDVDALIRPALKSKTAAQPADRRRTRRPAAA